MGISNPQNMVALIAGPTASGKTAFALHLARSGNFAIINADSAQVYSDLPILSAQPIAEEQRRVPHHLFGYIDGVTPCSAARWATDAKHIIAQAHARGATPILVGGSGLYIRTLLDGIAPIPEVDPALRAEIRAMPVDQAYAALQIYDASVAATLAATDISRITRALEVVQSTGRSILAWRATKTGGISADICLRPLLLLPPREWLYDRCDTRFEAMMERGAIEEVEALLARNLPQDAPIMRAIGVPEISAYLKGTISRAEAIKLGQIATRQYAKRQFTWFRNQAPADWQRVNAIINDSNIGNFEIMFQ
ncbi:tRNA (adenosine(37)-N6)-dimethylallyltransferase MiaA [Sphingorhabdus sp.]|jgi:tRNA dimethylallyltransferase|uniref:tRNA (adenosine(37)-N6)-dimethylallyltransferase MiaA n=1 Tax=Sphingorhabdus sp. TaxID=1902408 RepID=UPI0037C53D17